MFSNENFVEARLCLAELVLKNWVSACLLHTFRVRFEAWTLLKVTWNGFFVGRVLRKKMESWKESSCLILLSSVSVHATTNPAQLAFQPTAECRHLIPNSKYPNELICILMFLLLIGRQLKFFRKKRWLIRTMFTSAGLEECFCHLKTLFELVQETQQNFYFPKSQLK